MELKQAPLGPTTKKILGAPRPPTGEIWGVKVSTSPPLPPQIPFVRYRKSSGRRPGSTPATMPEILVNLRATQPEIFSLSNWPPASGMYGWQKPIKRSLLFCWILLHTLRDRSRRGQRREPQYGAPFFPSVPMSHDREHYRGTVSDGFYDSERPKTPNRKYYGHVTYWAMAPIDRA